MRTMILPSLLVLILAGIDARPLVAQAPPPSYPLCEFTRTEPIPASSTMSEQFECYKKSGRRVSVLGTSMVYGGVNGAGCIVSIATDRVQISSCNGFTEKSLTLPFESIRFIQEEQGKDYVTVGLRD